MKYLAIDTETLGLDPETCSLVEVAAVYDDGVSHINELKTYRRVVLQEIYSGDAYAMSMNGKPKIWADICAAKKDFPFPWWSSDKYQEFVDKNEAVHLDCLCLDLEQFLSDIGERKFVIAGKNPQFDVAFLTKNGVNCNDIFEHRRLDVGPMYALPSDQVPPSLKECLRRAGIEKEVAHNALDDCFDVVKCIRAKWGIPLEGTR